VRVGTRTTVAAAATAIRRRGQRRRRIQRIVQGWGCGGVKCTMHDAKCTMPMRHLSPIVAPELQLPPIRLLLPHIRSPVRPWPAHQVRQSAVAPELQCRRVSPAADCTAAAAPVEIRLPEFIRRRGRLRMPRRVSRPARANCAFCHVVAQSDCALCILHRALRGGRSRPDPRRPPTQLPSRRLVKTVPADQVHPRSVDPHDEGVPAGDGAEPLAEAQVQRNGALRGRVHIRVHRR
jgi:hypothetical protein